MTPAIALWLCAATSAQAAEVTELPPWLRGDFVVGYDYGMERSRLLEDDVNRGTRKMEDHVLTFSGVFSAGPGIAVWFAVPDYAGTRIQFEDTYEMVLEPNTDTGTMLDTSAQDTPPEVRGAGLGGTWIGIRGTPFSETLFSGRGDKATWLVELGYRFKDNSSLWALSESGDSRGGGPGAGAFQFRTAFSTTHRWAQPYVQANLIRSGRISADLQSETGEVLVSGVTLQPSSDANLRVGTEIVSYANEAIGAAFSVDLALSFGYRSWQDIPSGIYLPSVLDASRSVVATQSESSYLMGGVGLKYRIMEYVQLNIGADVGTVTPYQIEHFYPVSTGLGTFAYGVHTALKIRGRDRPERMPWDAR